MGSHANAAEVQFRQEALTRGLLRLGWSRLLLLLLGLLRGGCFLLALLLVLRGLGGCLLGGPPAVGILSRIILEGCNVLLHAQ